MEANITVTKLEQKELVNLLSTALYGSSYFSASYNKKIYEAVSKDNEECFNNKCFEDILAEILLAGHKIIITDYEAEGVSYSDKCVGFDIEDESADYEISLNDILKVASTQRGYRLLEDVLSGEGDQFAADAFLQIVVFGEEVYG